MNWKKVSGEADAESEFEGRERLGGHRENDIGNVANSVIGQSHGQDQETKRAVMKENQ